MAVNGYDPVTGAKSRAPGRRAGGDPMNVETVPLHGESAPYPQSGSRLLPKGIHPDNAVGDGGRGEQDRRNPSNRPGK